MGHLVLNKILLVEDDQDIQAIMRIALESIGRFTVKYATSGLESIQLTKDYIPDLILMDMMMPEMDGMTTYIELRKNQKLHNIPIIFITAKVLSDEVEIYSQLGAAAVITKPFDPLTLADQLREIWRERQNG